MAMDASGGRPMLNPEDVSQGLREWRNIQSVVRRTFRDMHEVIVSQGRRIEQLEHAIEGRALSEDVERALAAKASAKELDRVAGLKSEVEALDARVDKKADASALRELRSELGDAAGGGQAQAALRHHESAIEALRAELQDLAAEVGADGGDPGSGRRRSRRGGASAEAVRELRADVQRIEEGLASRPIRSEVTRRISQAVNEGHLGSSASSSASYGGDGASTRDHSRSPQRSCRASHRPLTDVGALDARFSELYALVEGKASSHDLRQLRQQVVTREEVEEAVRDRVTGSQLEARVAVNTEAVARELRDALVSTQEELISVLNKKAYKSDVQRALAKKAEEEDIRQALESKADVNDVREALALKADVSAMGALAGRGDSGASTGMNGYVAPADVISAVRESREAVVTAKRATEEAREAGGGVRELREELAQLSRALEGKSDAKEMCRLLDTKAAVEEVNQSLVEINKELDAKAEADAVRPIAAEQNALAQVVRVELAGGRWIWKSGRVSRGGRVPWNVQSVNHCPENLLWEPDGDRVTTVMPGLYALSLGVFCDRMPRVRVLVNNETVFVVPSEADGADTARRSKARVYRHSAGNVSGWTATEYLALPPRAQISLTYSGPDGAQGFLCLRKL